MGAKHSYGAAGRGDTLNFEPETLQVITDKSHPLYDPRVEREPDEGMILSIMAHGVIEPLIIFPLDGKAYVKDGHQRRMNAIEANKRLRKMGKKPVVVACVWRRGDNRTLFGISNAANEVRFSDRPIERAKKMQRAADFSGGDLDAVAVDFGVTVATVKNHLALLECAPAVQRAVEANKIPATAARKLSRMPHEEQTRTLDKMIESGATRGAAAQKAARGRGSEESLSKTLTATQRKRVREALAAQFETLRSLDLLVAKAVDAALALVDGDPKPLRAWPAIAVIVKDASEKRAKKADEKAA